MRIAAAALVAAALVILVAFVADIGPFAPGVEKRVSDHLGHEVDCSRAGLGVVAGERETTYRCSWHRPATETESFSGKYEQACVAIVDGRVYGVSCG